LTAAADTCALTIKTRPRYGFDADVRFSAQQGARLSTAYCELWVLWRMLHFAGDIYSARWDRDVRTRANSRFKLGFFAVKSRTFGIARRQHLRPGGSPVYVPTAFIISNGFTAVADALNVESRFRQVFSDGIQQIISRLKSRKSLPP